MFGRLWTDNFGESTDPAGEWAETLANVTDKQIYNAIDVIRDSGRQYPLSAPAFKDVCLKKKNDNGEGAYGGIHKMFKPRGLPEPEEHRERRKARGREEISKLKNMMRGNA
ncbi:hypothetical protein KC887_04755 [Candidatus Kaiserbacteria bacterium]|nr:hypothetical protein [Candidatus Kaiserbacteria bacterium]